MTARIITGDCLDVMREMAPASVDAIVTDPPYGLSFMSREWDHGVPGETFWREARRAGRRGLPGVGRGMKLLYIAGPYSRNPADGAIAARPIAVEAWQKGWAVICPHLNSYGMERSDVPPQAFYDGYLEMVRRCDAVLLIPGWRESSGATAEYDLAERLFIPIFEYEYDGVPGPEAIR